ncbi:MAG: DMT family transporter [Litorilinea sp.]
MATQNPVLPPPATPIAEIAPTAPQPAIGLFALLLMVDSLHFVFARALIPYFDPAISATLVMLVATTQVGLYGWYRGTLALNLLRRHFGFFLIIGACVGTSTFLTYASVSYIDAGTASMLSKMSTLFTLLIGVAWLREQLLPIQIVGAVVAIGGVFVISFQPGGDVLQIGSLLVVISTAGYALHTAVVKRSGGDMDFLNFFFFRLLLTTLCLAVLVLTRPAAAWTAPPAIGWWIVLLTGTVDVVISRSLYYLALRRITMSLHAIILTVSPVISIIWAYFLFDTFPGTQQLLGGCAVLAGVVIATRSRRRLPPLPATPVAPN